MTPAIYICAETIETAGISYELPTGLLSARRLIADKETPESIKRDLIDLIAQQEQHYEKCVDILHLPADAEEKGGITIALDPVEIDDVSDEEYMDEVFEAMLKMASNLDEPALQAREFVGPYESFGFYRMDVSNAYGTAGLQASFLTKKNGEQYLMILIMTDGDSHADRYNNVLESLRPTSDGRD